MLNNHIDELAVSLYTVLSIIHRFSKYGDTRLSDYVFMYLFYHFYYVYSTFVEC